MSCSYGTRCFRTNSHHILTEHPPGWKPAPKPGSARSQSQATTCPHGTSCHRTNQDHIRTEHSAGWTPAPKPGGGGGGRSRIGNKKTLYHETDAKGAQGIQATGFRCGTDGMAGGGIYFAVDPAHTGHKAHNHGFMITASVRLGRVKTIDANGDKSITLQSLKAEGYDSVMIPRPGGMEYVVYDKAQCTVISVRPTGGQTLSVAGGCKHGAGCYRTNPVHRAKYHGGQPPAMQHVQLVHGRPHMGGQLVRLVNGAGANFPPADALFYAQHGAPPGAFWM